MKTVVVLGAAGNTGRAITRLLLSRTDVRVVLAGRSEARLELLAGELRGVFPERHVSTARADAADPPSLRAAFSGATLVVVASSTSHYAAEIARACLESGADYLDVVVSAGKLDALRAMEADVVRAGRCFITDGGFHPGLPAALVRCVAPEFDRLDRAVVGSVIQVDWRGLSFSPSTIDEFLAEIVAGELESYRAGRWRKAIWLSGSDFPRMDFGPPFGRRYVAPMRLEEMRALPALYPTLRDAGFFVGGFNWFVDWLVFPLAAVALRAMPRYSRAPVGALMLWGLRAFSRPPFGTLLKVEASGTKDGAPKSAEIIIAHPDGYVFTALPVVACIEQCLDGSIAKPGLWLQALVVDAARLLADLEAMGARVERRATPAPRGAGTG